MAKNFKIIHIEDYLKIVDLLNNQVDRNDNSYQYLVKEFINRFNAGSLDKEVLELVKNTKFVQKREASLENIYNASKNKLCMNRSCKNCSFNDVNKKYFCNLNLEKECHRRVLWKQ